MTCLGSNAGLSITPHLHLISPCPTTFTSRSISSQMPTTRGQKRATDMEVALKTFFSSPRFAVAGASSDPSKYGHKSKHAPPPILRSTQVPRFSRSQVDQWWLVFAWYLNHGLPATPLNPRTPTVNILKRDHNTVASPKALSDPPGSSYSLSVITPPAVTKQLLKEAKEAGIDAVWLQPGSFDDAVLDYAKANFKAAIGGDGGGGSEGWCVLVDGEEGLRLAGRESSRL